MLYDICYWWFFLYQGKSRNIDTLHIPKYAGQNLLYWCLHLWSLWMAFTCCCPLSWQPIWLQSEVVDICFLHCHIFMQKLLCSVETVANNALNCWRLIVFDRLWTNAAHTLKTAFSLTNVHGKMVNTLPSDKFNSSAISHNFNLRAAKISLWRFLVFSRTTASIICFCTTAFKVSIPPLKHCLWWYRIQITLIKPLLCLSSIFSCQKQCFINTQNSDFFIVLKICNSSFI